VRSLLGVGVFGTIIVALCCFTPILIILLGAVGLSALAGYLDYVLLPSLSFFILLTIYALWRRQKRRAINSKENTNV
jgi:mercuric ion transport protein